jgi:formylglycine-generating enzyme required for sulfatase activity
MLTDAASRRILGVQDMVWIERGSFLMGSEDGYPEEAPVREVAVEGFWIDRYAVTNRDWNGFVKETGHVTLAERHASAEDYPGADPERLVPSSSVFVRPSQRVPLTDATREAPRPLRRGSPNTRLCTSRTRTPRPTRCGRASGFRQRRSGSSRRVGASKARPMHGATS